MNEKEVVDFFNEHKTYIGFGNYEVLITFSNNNKSNAHAEIVVKEIAQQIDLTFYKSFMEMGDDKQVNIIFHELVHGRVELKINRCEHMLDDEEEKMVNDIARLVENAKKYKKVNKNENKSTTRKTTKRGRKPSVKSSTKS